MGPSRLALLSLSTLLPIVFSTGLAAEPELDGKAIHEEKCADCHDEDGAILILNQKSPKQRQRALTGSHMRYHLPDNAERSAVIDYLKTHMREWEHHRLFLAHLSRPSQHRSGDTPL